jgi:hypothetical protein
MNLTAVTAASNVLSNLPLLLSRTPVWVWGLLLGLIALGFMQARTRELTYKRVLIIPIVMLVLSLLGAVSTAGGSFAAVGLWALGYVAVAYALSRRALPASVYAPDAGRFTVTGSYAPLGVMVAIFVIKFAVGVATAMGAAWVRSDAFSVVIAAFYGGFSGFFAGRALRLLRLAPFEPKAIVKPLLKTIAVLLFIVGLVLASLLMLGGPKPIAALPSITALCRPLARLKPVMAQSWHIYITPPHRTPALSAPSAWCWCMAPRPTPAPCTHWRWAYQQRASRWMRWICVDMALRAIVGTLGTSGN